MRKFNSIKPVGTDDRWHQLGGLQSVNLQRVAVGLLFSPLTEEPRNDDGVDQLYRGGLHNSCEINFIATSGGYSNQFVGLHVNWLL